MNKKTDNEYTWWNAFKDIPSYLHQNISELWHTPLWWKIANVIYLATLFGGIYFSIHYMIAWMDGLSSGDKYVYEPLHELIFWGWMFGTIGGMFLYRELFEKISTYILHKLGYIE